MRMKINETIKKYIGEISGPIGPEASDIISDLLDALFTIENKNRKFTVHGADFESIEAYYNNKRLDIIDNQDGSATIEYDGKEFGNVKDEKSLINLLKRKVL